MSSRSLLPCSLSSNNSSDYTSLSTCADSGACLLTSASFSTSTTPPSTPLSWRPCRTRCQSLSVPWSASYLSISQSSSWQRHCLVCLLASRPPPTPPWISTLWSRVMSCRTCSETSLAYRCSRPWSSSTLGSSLGWRKNLLLFLIICLIVSSRIPLSLSLSRVS